MFDFKQSGKAFKSESNMERYQILEREAWAQAISLREIIIFGVIIFIGLLVFIGLLQICRKRQRRILIPPIENKEMHDDKVRQQHIEERREGVYDEIDESTMSKTVTSSVVRPSLHSSYLDATHNPYNTMNIKNNPSSLSNAWFSSQSEPARHTSLRRKRHNPEENICDLNIQSGVGNEYSDGYLRPRVIANKDKMTEKENRGPIYDAPAYDGFSKSVSYDILIFAENVQNQTNGSILVHTPINSSKIQFDKKSRQPNCAAWSSNRKTI